MERTRHFFEPVTPELQAFMDNIDWAPFQEFLMNEYGINSELEVGLKTFGQHGRTIRPYIRCVKDLRDECGVFGKVQRFVRLENFSSGIERNVLSYDEKKYRKFLDERNYSFTDEDVDTVFGPITLWATMDLRYEHLNGGSNGTTLFRCQYTAENGRLFHKVGE